MNRSLWTQTLSEHHSPPWPCPTCRKGTLALVPKSLIHKETVWSKVARHDDDWTPDYITYAFNAWVKCGNPSCGEEAAVSGDGGVIIHSDEEGTTHWNYFTPRFSSPMPDIFELPQKCPATVKLELRAAFVLFWSDHSVTANRIRVALERLMDHLRIQKRRKNEKGKFYKLDLHKRIEVFGKTEPAIAGQLMSLKWLGNTGSHGANVMRDEVLDGFEILEHALLELFEQRTKRLTLLAKNLTEKHNPKARKPRPPF